MSTNAEISRRPIRVLFLVDTLSIFGGTERQLRELICHRDPRRLDPRIVTLYSMNMLHETELTDMGCPVSCLRIKGVMKVDGVRTVLKLARMIRRERIDVVQTFFPDASILGTLAARLGGAKAVIGRRDLGFWYTPGYRSTLRLLQRLAHAYVVNSEAVRAVTAKVENVDRSRIHVIYNGYFEPKVASARQTLADLGFPSDARLVGTVANLVPVKRLERFVQMAAAISDPKACFLIVGTGELLDQLTEQARQAGLGSRVRIMHSIHGVHEIIRLLDVAVLTSDSEGLSNSLVEFGFAGVPSVAFDVGGNADVIQHEKSGYLIEPFDVGALTQRVEMLLADEPLRLRMGQHASEFCTLRFNGPRMVEETEAFYERLVGGTP